MLAVAEAQHIVLRYARPLPPEPLAVGPDLLGLALAEPVQAERDSPPFDKSMVDGYALALGPGQTSRFLVVEEVMAGQVPSRLLGPGEACRIMTGAPVPAGTSAVVMVEQTESVGDEVLVQTAVRPGQNILKQASEMSSGAEVLRPGQPLRPAVLGLLASLGRTHVSVFRRPIVAILATGDELVEAGESPGPGQILNSNTPLLAGLTHSQHGRPHTLGIARDTRESLHRHLAFGLEADVLLISGGVSAGKLDLVPEVLVELQVEVHFHKVAMKPGKPLLFGTRDSTLVFGLPGNPVSSLVGFELFVRPVLRRLRGLEPALVPPVRAQVTTELQHRSDRPTWYPAVVAPRGSGWEARPLPWQGSADLRALAGATGLIQLPAGELTLPAGAEVEAVLLAD